MSLQIVRMETFPQLKALIDGVLDIAFIRAPERYPPELTGFVVDRHPYYAAIPKITRRRSESKSVLPRFRTRLLSPARWRWTSVSGEIWARSRNRDIRSALSKRAPDIVPLLTLVASGIGLGIISEPMRGLGIPGIVYRKISGALQEAEIAVAYRKGKMRPSR